MTEHSSTVGMTETKSQAFECEHLRFTVFPVQLQPPEDNTWWKDAVGEEPTTRTSQPRKGEYKDQGPYHGGLLTLGMLPGRIDWILSPDPEQAQEQLGLPSIGLFEETLETFSSTITKWLGRCPLAKRIAFGGAALLPATDRIEGYRKLAGYLPSVKVDPFGSRDFLYQINRPVLSAHVKRLEINRLGKWSVAAIVKMSGRIEIGKQATAWHSQEPLISACRIELDVNTSGTFEGELSGAELPQLLVELTSMARQLVYKGDQG
jgi:hypothetical protein